ncbi:FliM/FliN family flagellar motor C-terminal domain-containing protein [Methylobacillus arboreus]|uniref:FliM/FliN family flagellar motor switch protein n=1 Tax=Methylobacillus arboreus TaxID=755170 RepID=UPI001E54189C|nr:FliM/FliN family flagellar motor C-terminal domain-containing protein [Methylobacillus arboreus]MCB5191889.1 FliM/FliN family flagellar motor C-terminal domain-containing protein [Methylobacillus arboreus]
MPVALPFRLIAASGRVAVEETLKAVFSDWSKAWLGEDAKCSYAVDSDSAIGPDDEWLIVGNAPESWVAWNLADSQGRELVSAMMKQSSGLSSKPSPLTSALRQEALLDLFRRIQTLSSHELAQQYQGEKRQLRTGYGSGVVHLQISGILGQQELLIGGAVAEALGAFKPTRSPHAQAMVQRGRTLGRYVAHLEVLAGQAEITVQDLSGIEVGDVIRLSAKSADALLVRSLTGKQPVAKAYLGLQGNHKAIQFLEKVGK